MLAVLALLVALAPAVSAAPAASAAASSTGAAPPATLAPSAPTRGASDEQAPFIVGYDGSNPFDCRIQHVGSGVEFPDPDADPFCVEYDKTHQNVTDLGIVAFLRKEPARVAAASDKCFYYQRDHWHAAVDQHWEQTEIYNWDGEYYFDKARGTFGAYVESFTVNNSSVDPTALFVFPPEMEPYFGYGRGGIRVLGEIPVDPRCVAQAERDDPYARANGWLTSRVRRHASPARRLTQRPSVVPGVGW